MGQCTTRSVGIDLERDPDGLVEWEKYLQQKIAVKYPQPKRGPSRFSSTKTNDEYDEEFRESTNEFEYYEINPDNLQEKNHNLSNSTENKRLSGIKKDKNGHTTKKNKNDDVQNNEDNLRTTNNSEDVDYEDNYNSLKGKKLKKNDEIKKPNDGNIVNERKRKQMDTKEISYQNIQDNMSSEQGEEADENEEEQLRLIELECGIKLTSFKNMNIDKDTKPRVSGKSVIQLVKNKVNPHHEERKPKRKPSVILEEVVNPKPIEIEVEVGDIKEVEVKKEELEEPEVIDESPPIVEVKETPMVNDRPTMLDFKNEIKEIQDKLNYLKGLDIEVKKEDLNVQIPITNIKLPDNSLRYGNKNSDFLIKKLLALYK